MKEHFIRCHWICARNTLTRGWTGWRGFIEITQASRRRSLKSGKRESPRAVKKDTIKKKESDGLDAVRTMQQEECRQTAGQGGHRFVVSCLVPRVALLDLRGIPERVARQGLVVLWRKARDAAEGQRVPYGCFLKQIVQRQQQTGAPAARLRLQGHDDLAVLVEVDVMFVVAQTRRFVGVELRQDVPVMENRTPLRFTRKDEFVPWSSQAYTRGTSS